jgi:type I restriction enzyme S subunit
MTPSDVKIVADNIDDFIEVPDGVARLRKAVLTLAISGNLVPQDRAEGSVQSHQPNAGSNELFPIPKIWRWMQLDQIGSFGSGTGFPKEYQGDGNGEIPFFKVSDMNRNEKEMVHSVNWISRALAKKIRANILPAGTIVFPKIGGAIATNKRRVLITDSCIDNNCLGFIPSRNTYGDWVFMLFKSMDLTKYQVGTSVPALNIGKLSTIPVALPPISEQKRIVKKVGVLMRKLDDLEAKKRERDGVRARLTRSAMQALGKGESDVAFDQLTELVKTVSDIKELENALLTLAVSGKLVPQDPREGTGEGLYKEIQKARAKAAEDTTGRKKILKPPPPISSDEVPFEIPESWKWVRICEIGQVIGGGTPPTSDNGNFTVPGAQDSVPWLSPADMRNQKSIYISQGRQSLTAEGYRCSSATLMPTGTVIFSSRAPIGYVGIAANPLSTNQGFKSVIPSTGVSSEYVYWFLVSRVDDISARAPGTTFKEVSGTAFAKEVFALPPLLEQKRIVQKVQKVMNLIKKLRQEI